MFCIFSKVNICKKVFVCLIWETVMASLDHKALHLRVGAITLFIKSPNQMNPWEVPLFSVPTCEDLASFWLYSFSTCFSRLFAWNTHMHKRSQISWDEERVQTLCHRALRLAPHRHAYHCAAGPHASSTALLWQPKNHKGSPLIWGQLFIT